MSEVTARKWRPKLFSEFVGQDYITYSLKQSLKENKIAHGYLFSGPRGTGKTSTARVLATALNCLNFDKENLEPCLECKNCLEIRQGNSPDVIEIDGASNRGIDDMREMRNNIQFMPSYSKYKIYIIDEVHMLTVEAFNAILKILEEPPGYLVFMFATTELHKVKNTIRSRCQQFFLKRLTQEQISRQLEKILASYKIDYEVEAIQLIAHYADGSMRDSQSILDQAIVFSDGKIQLQKVKEILGVSSLQEFIDLFHIIAKEDALALKQFLQKLYIRGDDLEFFVLQSIEFLRNILLAQYNVNYIENIDVEIRNEFEQFVKLFNLHHTQTFIDLLMQLFKDMKETDHEFFLLEGTLLKMLQYKQFVNLQEVIERLSLLEDQTNTEDTISNIRIDDTQNKNIDVVKIFSQWKKNQYNPRVQKILLDIKEAQWEKISNTLKLEFLTQEGYTSFMSLPEIKKDIKKYFLDNYQIMVNIEEMIKMAHSSLEKNNSKNDEELLNQFISELNGTVISED